MRIKDIDTKKIIFIITYTVLLIAIVFNIDVIFNLFNEIIRILNPVIIGIVFAFIFNILMKKYEVLLFKKDVKNNKLITGKKRVLSMTLTYLTIGLVLFFISYFLIPELISSAKTLINNLDFYSTKITDFSKSFLKSNDIISEITRNFLSSWADLSKKITEWVVSMAPTIVNTTVSFFGSVVNIILGLVFSVYLLYSKEKLITNMKNTLYAFVKKSKADKTMKIATLSNKTFSAFVGGQLIEAVILGTLCTIGMLILKMPYSILIGVLVGLTSLIPIFGAYLGAIPSAFLLLMENPVMSLIFIVYLVILQQIEGNVIYPKVVGKSVGLSGFWILLAVVVGAAIGGVAGVLLAVPICSITYTLIEEEVNKKIKTKKIKINN